MAPVQSVQVYVSLFDWNWVFLGCQIVAVPEGADGLHLHRVCTQAADRILGDAPKPPDIHMTVTTGRPPTVEEAKEYYGGKGGPDSEEWVV